MGRLLRCDCKRTHQLRMPFPHASIALWQKWCTYACHPLIWLKTQTPQTDHWRGRSHSPCRGWRGTETSYLHSLPIQLACCNAVEVNGHSLAQGTSETTTTGLYVNFSNITVPDGTLWMHPGAFMLPTVTMTTDRWALTFFIQLGILV